MNYYIQTYGCQMNKSDSERIAAVLESAGWTACSKEETADLIIVIACSVRQTAVDRVYGRAQKYKELKKKNPRLKTLLTGCVLDSDKKKLADKFDIVCDIGKISQISNFKFLTCPNDSFRRVSSFSSGRSEHKKINYNYLTIKPKYQSNFQAYVPIMTGCNNFCSYCVVPYTRGREYSRPSKDILNEIRRLIKNDYKEIFLLGQNVNSYNDSQNKKNINFPALLRLINSIPYDFWIRFATSHPKDMTDELISAIAECEKITPYLHLPIQSGSDKILKAMNRKYTKTHYLGLIKKIKARIPNIMFSTDVIVGFPKETKKDFQETVDIFKKVKYTMAYIARYSPRAGTASYGLKNNVAPEKKAERENILTKILKKTALENNKKFIGKTVRVLVESQTDDYCIGKTAQFINMKIKSNHSSHSHLSQRGVRGDLIGNFINIKILKATSFGMEGR
ncbi:MAG: tRNA (N6-isopentenyl adenosine(37)-C2)-methylthiotransferase MiaB [bacterium]